MIEIKVDTISNGYLLTIQDDCTSGYSQGVAEFRKDGKEVFLGICNYLIGHFSLSSEVFLNVIELNKGGPIEKTNV